MAGPERRREHGMDRAVRVECLRHGLARRPAWGTQFRDSASPARHHRVGWSLADPERSATKSAGSLQPSSLLTPAVAGVAP
jgi:hypothetical protein